MDFLQFRRSLQRQCRSLAKTAPPHHTRTTEWASCLSPPKGNRHSRHGRPWFSSLFSFCLQDANLVASLPRCPPPLTTSRFAVPKKMLPETFPDASASPSNARPRDIHSLRRCWARRSRHSRSDDPLVQSTRWRGDTLDRWPSSGRYG